MDIRPVNKAKTKVCVTFENELEEEIADLAIHGDNPFPRDRFTLKRVVEFYGTELGILDKPTYPRDVVLSYRRLGDIASDVFIYAGDAYTVESHGRARTALAMGERIVEYWSGINLTDRASE